MHARMRTIIWVTGLVGGIYLLQTGYTFWGPVFLGAIVLLLLHHLTRT
jgi:hypothetical protein